VSVSESEFAFDAFGYFEPVKRAYDRRDMT